jgi:hypothetical protein
MGKLTQNDGLCKFNLIKNWGFRSRKNNKARTFITIDIFNDFSGEFIFSECALNHTIYTNFADIIIFLNC